jgi:hypothetical protein
MFTFTVPRTSRKAAWGENPCSTGTSVRPEGLETPVNRYAARIVFAHLIAEVVYGVFVVYSGYESIRDPLVDWHSL